MFGLNMAFRREQRRPDPGLPIRGGVRWIGPVAVHMWVVLDKHSENCRCETHEDEATN